MSSLAEWNNPPVLPGRPSSVLGKIVAVLDAVKRASDPLSINELAAESGMPKSTVSRLVADLVEQRYLERTERGVTLGMRLFELGARASLPRRLMAAAAPIIQNLWEATGERVGLWVQQGTDMVSIAALPGRLPMLSTHAGMRSPALTTASGKAYLAFCPDLTVMEQVCAPLPESAAETFRVELGKVREAVVASDRGVSYRGIAAVASPVLAADHRALGAISVAGPADDLDAERVAALVRSAGETLTRRLCAA